MSDPVGIPWPAQTATGVGSMPGTDPDEAIAVVLGELPNLPHLPELPARGPGADMVGRTAALLVDMPVETTGTSWRLAERPGRDMRRAAGLLSADLDAMEAAAGGCSGVFKIQLCGPWTLAASLELTRSVEPALGDPGAVADLTASLAEAAAAHVAAVRRRLPDATILVQFDEPALPGVIEGSVRTASGLRRVPAVEESVAADGLAAVLAATSAPTMLHCCAPRLPFGCLTRSGATAVSFDLALLRREDEDAIGEVAESGLGIAIGAVPAVETARYGGAQAMTTERAARDIARSVVALWNRIGLLADALTDQVAVTPACGLAGASPAWARAALTRCQAAANLIPELIEEGAP